MNRIDHTKCSHEATPKARKACRKATRAAAEARAERIEREARFDADMARLDAAGPTVERYTKRAIVVNFVMKDGTHNRVVFDRYGMNAELFNTALACKWSAERTVAQACSEAISSVLELHGAGSIERHSVHEIS